MSNSQVNVPLLDLKSQYAVIQSEVNEAIRRVLASQLFILGPEVEAFEHEIAEYCNVKYAVGCANGSDAILLALMAIGIQPGDEVICPAFTFFATAGSTWRLGAVPVFADIDPVTFNMDIESVREKAAKCKNLKAIMPVHLYGQCVDMDAYLDLGREFGVPVVEDAAQAIGARDENGSTAGSRGIIGCFSFFPTKNLGAYGEAGLCTTNDESLAHRIRILRNQGMEPKYYHKFVGFNSRLDAIQAAVLRVKLKYLDQWSEARRENAGFYNDKFNAVHGLPIRIPQNPTNGKSRHIYHQYVIRVSGDIRDELRTHLSEQGITTEIYYPVPVHLQECFTSLGYSDGDLPNSEQAAKETIALPIFPDLTEEQLTHVADTIIEFISTRVPVKSH